MKRLNQSNVFVDCWGTLSLASYPSSSYSSRSHLVVGSLRQTQFSSSQFCHGPCRRSDGSHVSVDTVHPYLFRSSSLSSPGWYHLQSLYSDVVSPLYVAKPPESRFPAPLCDTLSLAIGTIDDATRTSWN